MKDLITSEPTSFDKRRKTFGTASGMAILKELQMMKDSIAAPKQHLDLLAPVQRQVRLIRKPVLQSFAYCPTEPTLRQAGNGLAHGGQVISNLSIIDSKNDPAECAVLKSGFERLYAVSPTLRHEFVKYTAVTNIMNMHANLVTLDVFHWQDPRREIVRGSSQGVVGLVSSTIIRLQGTEHRPQPTVD